MYDTSLRQLLSMPYLLGSYASRSAPRQFHLTETFYVNPEEIPNDEYDLIHWPQMQEPVAGNVPQSEARILQVGEGTRRRVALFYTYNKAALGGTVLEALQADTQPTLNRIAMEAVNKIQADFAIRHQIFKEGVLGQILSFGAVNMDGMGRLILPSVDASTGVLTHNASAVYKSEFSVPNDHRGNCGGIFTAQASTAGTLMLDQLDLVKIQAEEDGSDEPTEILLHPINKKHLRNNTQFQLWATENQVNADNILRGGYIENFAGFNWHFYGGTYKAADGTKVPYINKNVAVITPPPTDPWCKATAGVNLVPTTIDIATSLDEAINSLQSVAGQFAFARVQFDPVAAWMFMGDKFGFHFADPNAIWIPKWFTN